MSVTPEPVGTEPVVTDPAAGGGGGPQPTPASDGDLQVKYDGLLDRLTALETGKQAAEAERDSLLDRINERLETNAPPAQPNDDTADMQAAEQSLLYSAHNGTPDEKRIAKWMLGLAYRTRQLPGEFSEQMAMAPLDTATRQQVQAVMKEAAASGNRITPDYARDVVNLRAQQAELTKLRAQPAPQPPNTRLVPSPVSIGGGGQITDAQMNAEWPTASSTRKSELLALDRAGKVVPG